MEDIDQTRCKPEFETSITEDLAWLGITWQPPVIRQSERFHLYQEFLGKLKKRGLVYPSFMTRGDIRKWVSEIEAENGFAWPRDPDGSPHYPGSERNWSDFQREEKIKAGKPHAWRLDMQKALAELGADLSWREWDPSFGTQILKSDPASWGDVILARSDVATSYHLSVVVDDAVQDITHIVRGKDLYHATSVHRLLQELLDLRQPIYHHHDLVLDEDGKKLSKSNHSTALACLRRTGMSPADIRQRLHLPGQ